jgi:hypothetical protein
VYHDDHFTSDVLAGAAIGALVGKTIVTTNRKWRVTPLRRGAAVSISW